MRKLYSALRIPVLAFLMAAAVLPLNACSSISRLIAPPTTTSTQTATPTATSTPTQTATPTPTQTPLPTATSTPDPAMVAIFKPGEPIKIGMGAPMTGDNGQFGLDISLGARLAIQDAGDFQGWKFELDVQDDQGTPAGGAIVARNFVSDPAIVAIAGHIFSGSSASAIPIYTKAGIPMMSPSATEPDLTNTGNQVFNRVNFTDPAQGKFTAAYLYQKLHIKDLVIVNDGDIFYGWKIASVVEDEFKKLGGNVVAFFAITPGLSDYSAELERLASKNPRHSITAGMHPRRLSSPYR
ncbi:MAG: branched-chain amino acid ABC transporter substrate-binding protein [Omnitrophica WOR_2 bacterium]